MPACRLIRRDCLNILSTSIFSSSTATIRHTHTPADTYLTNYRLAVVTCVGAGGDVDTTAAIVGGVVAAHLGIEGIPAEWYANRETLPDWLPNNLR